MIQWLYFVHEDEMNGTSNHAVKMKIAYNILVEIPERRGQPWEPYTFVGDWVTIRVKEKECEGADWIN
jgi:hypothetical protein